MRLPFFTKNVHENKTFFGLLLKEKEGVGLVIRMENSKVVLVDQEKFVFSDGWEHLSEDIDQIILKLEKNAKVQLHDTIFFLYSHFVDEKTKEIKKPYLEKIKEIVKSLNLKALGYIECFEAVIHYLEKKEELPLSAVLIELDQTSLSVFIYKRGALTYSKVLAHTDNLIEDLMTSFLEIKGKFLLPSRIILYNSKDLDSESTEIVTYRWSEELFVQLPRVETVKEHELMQGLLGVFAEQFSQKTTSTVFREKKPQDEILGFVIGGDVTEKKSPIASDDSLDKVSMMPQLPLSAIIDKAGSLVKRISAIPQIFNKKWTAVFGSILVVVGLLANEYFFHKAALTVYLPHQVIKKDLTLNTPDLDIETTSKSIDLSDSKSTTGKKEIGEEARGSLTLHNFDDKEKVFSKGTAVETAGLRFTLDQEVKVASSSVVTINGGLVKQPGKTKANVTADAIGPQSNIAQGKQFKIADLPNTLYFGINESPFAGGSKKEVRTASKKDMDDLIKSLQEFVKKKGLDEIEQNQGESGQKNLARKILPELTEIDLTETKFNKEIGEETDTLDLQAKVKITVYSYKEKELTDRVTMALSQGLQKGFILEKSRLSYKIDLAEKIDSKITVKIAASGRAIRDVSTDEVIKVAKGVSRGGLETSLKDSFKVQGFELDIEPKIPIFKDWMPFFEKNISLKISSL